MEARYLTVVFFVFASLWAVPRAHAIALGQVDTFENGTALNWSGGSFPTNMATDGPAGAGDHYLRINSNNAGLATRNDVQWSGNYTAAGVNAIGFDLRNQGTTALDMRIVLFNSPGGDFTTTTSVALPADNVWHHVVFGLSAGALTYVGGGTGNLSDTLASVGRLLIRHQSGASAGASTTTPVTGILGIDNITAVPEPNTAITCIAAVVLAAYMMMNGTKRGRV